LETICSDGGKKLWKINIADVAELVDARDLKSLDGNVVRVRVPPPAPAKPTPLEFSNRAVLNVT
jgi:hypothetical protein